MKKIAIIGAGFTGLSAAYDLVRAGHQVTVYEQKSHPGGFAGGFKAKNWQWSLEFYYHHVFATDKDIKKWLAELNLVEKLFFKTAPTYTLLPDEADLPATASSKKNFKNQLTFAQLDSPISLLKFPQLSFLSKLRTGAVLAGLKFWPKGSCLERYTAKNFICATMGHQSWQVLWQPLFVGKFGELVDQVNAAWFWARIYARSQELGYFENGFLGMAEDVVEKLKKMGVNFEFSLAVSKIKKNKDKSGWQLIINHQQKNFDQVIFTGSSRQFLQIAGQNFSEQYTKQLKKLRSLAASTLILALNRPFLKNKIYWLNINKNDWPFLAVVEHTNFIDRARYDNQHLVYVGKYLPEDDPLFSYSKEKLFEHYQPYLEQLCPGFQENLVDYYLFKDVQAQPVVGKNHSRILPEITTPLPDLYWAGMEHVYPYDRGINYAVKLGRAAAKKITSHQ